MFVLVLANVWSRVDVGGEVEVSIRWSSGVVRKLARSWPFERTAMFSIQVLWPGIYSVVFRYEG